MGNEFQTLEVTPMSPTPADCRDEAVPQRPYVTTRAVSRWLDRHGVSL